MSTNKSAWISTALLIGGVATLMWLERRRPLRRSFEPGFRRIARNFAVGAVTAATVSAIERPLVTHLARAVEERGFGLLPRLPLPAPLKTALAVVLMDYTLYWWHVLLHRVPSLWRLHEPHHIDRDLDTSTGVRFHFAEFLASIPWRCAQIVAIGVTPRALSLWQKLTLAEVLFHHSNLRLSRKTERDLSRIVVTPRLHGIHHSIIREERDSNFSSGLSIWDRLHGTARVNLDDEYVIVGLAGHRNADDVTLAKTLALPFENRDQDERIVIARRRYDGA